MDKYIYTKKSGGIAGLPHEIDKSVGDAWIAEYEEAKKENEERRMFNNKGDRQKPMLYLDGMPGCILLAALKNESYVLKGEKRSKPPKESKKDSKE